MLIAMKLYFKLIIKRFSKLYENRVKLQHMQQNASHYKYA